MSDDDQSVDQDTDAQQNAHEASDVTPDDSTATIESDRAPDDDAPLSELAERVADRRREKQSGEQTVEDPFEEMSVPEIDGEALWESISDGSDGRPPGYSALGDESALTLVEDTTETEYVVQKETYCQKCPHLDDPPELACTHDGTDIVEVVDSDHFRVRNCPMVED